MKTWRSLVFAAVVLVLSVVTTTLVVTTPGTRSVGPAKLVGDKPAQAGFSRAESTGLFVGVKEFRDRDTLDVPYAADDAVDLAYRFSLDQRSSLIPPQRVVLALSGRPMKKESQERLRELREAGAQIKDATSDDIHDFLREQVARAGTSGLFVLSLASHGFLDENGDAWVLGSNSRLGAPEGSLRMETLFDVAGRATRSLVFVDACRDRVAKNARGVAPDPMTVAPLLAKMARIEGQVIFFAAAADQYAYDDEVHQNGVFTKAVLDGLDCGASSPRGQVIASTLHTYVQRAVRRWLVEHDKTPVDPVTQVRMEGATRNMPLTQCWRSAKFPIRASADGATLSTYDADTEPLWVRKFADRIAQADAADLDADAFYEVVVGAGHTIQVFDRDGKLLWEYGGDGMRIVTFAIGDLFRKHTNQVVALWTDGHASRLTVLDSKGAVMASCEHAGLLDRVFLGRPNNHHNQKIIASSIGGIFVFDARKLARLWTEKIASPVQDVRVVDRNIEVVTKSGRTVFTFDGRKQ